VNKSRGNGEGCANGDGYMVYRKGKGRLQYGHILVAEKVLGCKLPPDAVVHHIDEDPSNNAPTNLLICTRPYHNLLHARMRALAACGNPDWRKCVVCKEYDDLANMRNYHKVVSYHHAACWNERRREHSS